MLWIIAIAAGLWVLSRSASPAVASGQKFVSPYAAQNAARPPIFTVAPIATMQPEAAVAAQKIGMAIQYNALPKQYQAPIAQPENMPMVPDSDVTYPAVQTQRMLPPGAASGTDVSVQKVAPLQPVDHAYNLIYSLPPVPVGDQLTARLDPDGAVSSGDLEGRVQWDWPTFEAIA